MVVSPPFEHYFYIAVSGNIIMQKKMKNRLYINLYHILGKLLVAPLPPIKKPMDTHSLL
jgi:hypothetical protein